MFWTQKFLLHTNFSSLAFLDLKCCLLIFLVPPFLGPKVFWSQNFFDRIFLVKNVFGQNFFTTNIFLPYFLTYLFLFQILLTPNFLPIFFLTQFFKIQYCFWGTKHVSYLKWEAKFQTNEKLNFKLHLTKLVFAV